MRFFFSSGWAIEERERRGSLTQQKGEPEMKRGLRLVLWQEGLALSSGQAGLLGVLW